MVGLLRVLAGIVGYAAAMVLGPLILLAPIVLILGGGLELGSVVGWDDWPWSAQLILIVPFAAATWAFMAWWEDGGI